MPSSHSSAGAPNVLSIGEWVLRRWGRVRRLKEPKAVVLIRWGALLCPHLPASTSGFRLSALLGLLFLAPRLSPFLHLS